MNEPIKRMTVQEFLDWSMAQPQGRYELVLDLPIKMPAKRARHRALEDAISRAGAPLTIPLAEFFR